MTDESNEKKLIIDEDWKVQAQKDKEKLQEEVAQETDKKRPEFPPADFGGLVSLLATQAFYALGLIRTEESKDAQIEPDWAMAKYNIDMLAMLEVKCKGTLEPEEAAMLTATLEQLRMAFVQLSQQ